MFYARCARAQLCQKGELYSIERVENETGISKNDLIRRLKYGLEIKNHQNRIQHLCIIPPDYVGFDSEAATKKCLTKWLVDNNYRVYGENGLEVPFRQNGLQAIFKLAKSQDIKDFVSIETLLRRNGIDLVAFSKEKGEVLLIELKGWTNTTSDFNETIHQTLKRINSLHHEGFLLDSIKFACAFPDFLPVPKWEVKYQNLKNIINNPRFLLHFSSATNTVKRKGEPFLKKFIDGPIKIQDLIISDRFAIYKVRSPEYVVNLFTM